MPDKSSPRRQVWLLVFKLAVVAAVCVAVSGTLRDGWAQLAEHSWQWKLPWLLAAGAIYLFGLLPMAWFWRRTLAALGEQVGWLDLLHAYYLGHLGKYVPGKALVVVIRVGALRQSIASIRLAVASVLVETLTMMSVGGVLAAALSIVVLELDWRLALLAAAMAVVAGVPTLPPIARRLAGRSAASQIDADSSSSQVELDAMQRGVTFRLLAAGWFAAAVTWIILAASLWAALRGIGVTSFALLGDLPLLVTTVSFAMVAGFLSLLPGGIVVRDVLLVELLAHECGEAQALVAAVLLRIVWLMSELAICAILKVVRRTHHRPPTP